MGHRRKRLLWGILNLDTEKLMDKKWELLIQPHIAELWEDNHCILLLVYRNFESLLSGISSVTNYKRVLFTR